VCARGAQACAQIKVLKPFLKKKVKRGEKKQENILHA
jgi:hypothetical protein